MDKEAWLAAVHGASNWTDTDNILDRLEKEMAAHSSILAWEIL